MKSLLFAAALLPLAACAQYDLAAGVVRDKGAEAADRALEASRYYQCEAATIGSIRREYGGTREGATIHRDFCGYRHEIVGPRD